ncbi:hypothetical protein FXF51_05660 [Nonomuraea sp. PA05]|uniref:helix-turn-helix domain-containing protein n=1 Tax=Nonomuraea sp. PA05 TaxID=2604466 RepID=UPI0011DA3E38|nr:helix-turn-helix transcriptional regulator [Nonomuraea sp. PA05]TYB69646.1 hypothetical protein FXF51_05660 [Nonomuraea sp. PA05]
MSQGATIRLRQGAGERLKRVFDCTTNTQVAESIGVDQGHYSRVLNGRADPGPYFQGNLLLAARDHGLTFDDLFEVVELEERKSA